MNKRTTMTFITAWRRTATILVCGVTLVTATACAMVYTDAMMGPLAATASDLARAVMGYVKDHPAESASLDDQELVRRATGHDPKLLGPYKGYVVRGRGDGIILVCTRDGSRGLIEDAECTDEVDKPEWQENNTPCLFTLNPATLCPQASASR